MKLLKATVLMMSMMLPGGLLAQAIPAAIENDVPRMEVGLNYNYLHANAPPGECGCFGLNGGNGTFVYNLRPQWAAVADITLAYAGNADNTGQNILIFNYLFGPRYTWRNRTKYVPYGQFLFGGAKEDVNFDFTINRNAFGFATGGGVIRRVTNRIGVTLGQVDWVYTRIPNAKNDRQNDIRVTTGVLYRF